MMLASRRLAGGAAAARFSGTSSTAASGGICTDDATSGMAIAEVKRSANETRTTVGLPAGTSSSSDEILRTAAVAASAGIFTTVVNAVEVDPLLGMAEVVSSEAKAAAGRSPSESDAVC